MAHPLENYRAIAEPNFIFHLEERFYTSYHDELINGLHVEIDKNNDRMYVNGIDLEGNGFDGYTTLSTYFLKEYDKLEKETRSNIETVILTLLDENKQQVFTKNVITEVQVIQNRISKLSVQPKYEPYKSILIDKAISFSRMLQEVYQPDKEQKRNSTPKIQWLAETNLLTTLLYDLLNGQKKATKGAINTKPFIKAKTADIERLLIENFLDSNGKPLSPGTIKTYLNNSRPETRVREGGRIELSL